ncbi:MAG: uracil-DNA glycosylase [Gammaproteobacteria bacterium]|nr:uracil-DNA glycosylase [Gammaproteobacteria bacterium]
MSDHGEGPLDQRRRQMLDAMGIQYWVRRDLPTGQHDEVVPGREPLQESQESMPGETMQQLPADWESLQLAVSNCRKCSLSQSRQNTVFGTGDQDARVMVIGEAPGEEEDRQGLPFVGRAGLLLNQMLLAAGLSRESVYIANILKCRPPGNRNPDAQEMKACHGYLQQQISLIQPEVILATGGVAAKSLLQSDEAVGRLRGRMHHYGESKISLLVTYHPSYLLRKPSEKAKSWQDLQLLMKQLQ